MKTNASRLSAKLVLLGFGVVLLASSLLNVIEIARTGQTEIWLPVIVKSLVGLLSIYSGIRLRSTVPE
jgi:hypothetical protein